MAEPLTPNACEDLNNPNAFSILLASPIVGVVSLTPATGTELRDFTTEWIATVTDGNAHAHLLLAHGLRIFGCGADFDPSRTLQAGDVIKLERMIRLPCGDTRFGTSAILVHDVELFSDGPDVPLQITNYEDKIAHLTKTLQETEACLREMLKPHVSEALLNSVMAFIVAFNTQVTLVLEGKA